MQPARRLLILALLVSSSSLLGADCLGVLLDDDDSESVVLATDSGYLGRLAGTSTEASTTWTGEIANSNRVSVVADAESVYVGAASQVRAVALTGLGEQAETWTWSAPDDVVALAGPGDGRLYVMTTSTLHALGTDGGEIWSVDLLLDLTGVADDAIAFGGGALILGGNPVRRLNPATGAVTHTLTTGSTDVSAVAVSGGVAYIATATGVVAAAAADLVQQWEHPTSAEVDEVHATASSIAYAVRGGEVGLLAIGGNPVFDSGSETGVFDGLLIAQNLVVAARADGDLLAWDEGDGSLIWSESLSGPVGGLDANGVTVFYGHGDELEALNLSDGSTLWRLSTTGSPTAVLAL